MSFACLVHGASVENPKRHGPNSFVWTSLRQMDAQKELPPVPPLPMQAGYGVMHRSWPSAISDNPEATATSLTPFRRCPPRVILATRLLVLRMQYTVYTPHLRDRGSHGGVGLRSATVGKDRVDLSDTVAQKRLLVLRPFRSCPRGRTMLQICVSSTPIPCRPGECGGDGLSCGDAFLKFSGGGGGGVGLASSCPPQHLFRRSCTPSSRLSRSQRQCQQHQQSRNRMRSPRKRRASQRQPQKSGKASQLFIIITIIIIVVVSPLPPIT